MSQCFFIELERRTPAMAWERIDWTLPLTSAPKGNPGFDPYEFYDRALFYVLTAESYRLDVSACPKPLVVKPRGAPPDRSPRLANCEEDERYLYSWLYPYEALLYDWCEYERYFDHQRRQLEQEYEARNGHPFKRKQPLRAHTPVEFLDAIAELEPTDGYRLVFGME